MEQTLLHKCGLCNTTFSSEEEYVNHVCPVTQLTPQHPDHMGEGFKAVSEGALARGNLKNQLCDAGYSPEQADVIAANVVSQADADIIASTFIKK